MTNLPVPVLAQEAAGNLITGALWNANVYNGLTYILNPPIFYGVQATSQSVSNSTNTSVTLDTGVVDTYGGHSNTTNNSRYIAQVAGYYLIAGCVGYAANATGFRQAQLRVNGTAVQGGTAEIASSSASFATTLPTPTIIKYLNVGDYVELWTWQTSGAALSTTAFGDQACSLSVQWIHA